MTDEQREIAWEYVLLTLEFYPRYLDRAMLVADALHDIGHCKNWQAVYNALITGI